MKEICRLAFEPAINATVMYKHGVCNKYAERPTEDVIESIQKSGYGADVRYDEGADRYFVSIPCDADMW